MCGGGVRGHAGGAPAKVGVWEVDGRWLSSALVSVAGAAAPPVLPPPPPPTPIPQVRLAKEAQEAAAAALAADPGDDVAHHLAGRWNYEMAQARAERGGGSAG